MLPELIILLVAVAGTEPVAPAEVMVVVERVATPAQE